MLAIIKQKKQEFVFLPCGYFLFGIVMLNLFQHPTCTVIILSVTLHVGSRNKFGMTLKDCYSLRKLFTGLAKAAFIVCSIIRNAVIADNKAIEKTKGESDILIL